MTSTQLIKTPPLPPTRHGDATGARKWLPLSVMGLAVVIIALDTTLLNVSLSAIIKDLHTNIQSLQWVISGYALTLAALTVTGGRFGDLFGRKKMFVLGACVFAVGSFLASESHGVPVLIIGESVIEGLGAALMMPATASLLISNYRGHDRALALGIWGGMAAVGTALGPLVGGYLTTHYSWRWGFRINIFVAALLVVGSIWVNDPHERGVRPAIDWLGVFLSSLGLFFGVFAIIEGATYGWFKAIGTFMFFGWQWPSGGLSVVPACAILSLVLLSAFIWWEQNLGQRGGTPLVSPRLFKIEQFRDGAILTGALSLGQVGLIFGLPVFLQGVRGMNALQTGYALIPLSVGLLIMSPLGGFLARHIVPKHIVQLGLFVTVVALIMVRQVLSTHTTSADLIIPLFLYGIGLGLNISQLGNITLSAVSVKQSGEASGVNNTIRQIGASLGTAIIGSIIVASIAAGLHTGIKHSSVLPQNQRAAISKAASQQTSAVEFGANVTGSNNFTKTEAKELRRIAQNSIVAADKRAFLFTIFTTALAWLLAIRLPNTKHLERNESLEPSVH